MLLPPDPYRDAGSLGADVGGRHLVDDDDGAGVVEGLGVLAWGRVGAVLEGEAVSESSGGGEEEEGGSGASSLGGEGTAGKGRGRENTGRKRGESGRRTSVVSEGCYCVRWGWTDIGWYRRGSRRRGSGGSETQLSQKGKKKHPGFRVGCQNIRVETGNLKKKPTRKTPRPVTPPHQRHTIALHQPR
jgi:hypothetical protein